MNLEEAQIALNEAALELQAVVDARWGGLAQVSATHELLCAARTFRTLLETQQKESTR